MSQTNNNDSFNIFLQHFVDSPILILTLFPMLWLTWLIYKDKLSIILMSFKKEKPIVRKITKKDLVNHQVFSDLDFWIDHRINELYTDSGTSKKDMAKTIIARDLLLIKFSIARDWLKNIVETCDFSDKDVDLDLRRIISRDIEKNKSVQYSRFKQEGIPQLFIDKWFEISKLRYRYLEDSIVDVLLTEVNISVMEKMYLLLGHLSMYFQAFITEMGTVIQSINGDLRGQVYKDMIIGGNDYRYYPVPRKEYVPLVNIRLHELAILLNADRVSVFLFHDVPGEDFLLGNLSKIYGYEQNNLPAIFRDFQYIPTLPLAPLIGDLKQHKGVYASLETIHPILGDFLKKANCSAIIGYPMFIKDSLKAILCASYVSTDRFECVNKEDAFKTLKEYSSLLNTYIDYSKSGLNYANIIHTGE